MNAEPPIACFQVEQQPSCYPDTALLDKLVNVKSDLKDHQHLVQRITGLIFLKNLSLAQIHQHPQEIQWP